MAKKKENTAENISAEDAFRSLENFFVWVEKRFSPSQEFRQHMANSRVEFLKGVRSLIDKRIDNIEKRQTKKSSKSSRKINVE